MNNVVVPGWECHGQSSGFADLPSRSGPINYRNFRFLWRVLYRSLVAAVRNYFFRGRRARVKTSKSSVPTLDTGTDRCPQAAAILALTDTARAFGITTAASPMASPCAQEVKNVSSYSSILVPAASEARLHR